jgi:hypothetical protein
MNRKNRIGKNRKYLDSYMKYGFTQSSENGQIVPKCVVCFETLSNDALRPNRLIRHLRSKHPDLQEKPLAFFESKRESYQKMKLVIGKNFHESSNGGILETSYEIAYMIAKAKKPQ